MDKNKIKNIILKYRLAIIIAIHMFIITLSYLLAFASRLDFTFYRSPAQLHLLAWSTPFLLALRLFSCWYFDLFRGLWRFVSLRDLLAIIKASLLGTLFFAVFIFLATRGEGFPRSVFLIDFTYNIILMGGIRMAVRLFRENIQNFRLDDTSERRQVLIVGAGAAGEMILREIQNNPRLGYDPVGFVDDDKSKHKTTIHGVPVLGDTSLIETLVKHHGIREVIIAIPSAASRTIRKIVASCQAAGAGSKTLPFIGDLIDGRVSVSQIRKVSIEDLLGREPTQLDMSLIGRQLAGRVILITGAAGSIGSELVRQTARFGPKKIILYDQSENDLFHLELELKKDGPAVEFLPVIGDIRDKCRVRQCLERHRPSYMFHAAAYKHVPLMEVNPVEAVKNNIFGTQILAEAAAEYGVENFVLISSDKAVRPTNVMGATKRVAELILQAKSRSGGKTQFLAVRFGNVLGSNGSVIPIFQKQIAAGGPVTITHPDITRYFMTIPEAALLVIQAGAMGQGGEIFLLEMGESMKIRELAENLIYLSGLTPGLDIDIVYTGLRPGEKLYEELLIAGEGIKKTHHDKIRVLNGQDIDGEKLAARLQELEALCHNGDNNEIKRLLKELVPEYQPYAETEGPAA
ncbi:MAG: nucleoside-diphosphate sugar epimerase/dehydratase [Smithellaceae bacterium]|nr:nucleoside-diphosphate sugar epimerase/dehydratase [Smithellaceae bacterium]